MICWGSHNETLENSKLLMDSGCVVTAKNDENIIVSSEKAIELEKAAKLNNPYEESSEARQKVEKGFNAILKRLREEQK